ncbi:MAG TPA: carboxypeptidase regulatory-like domain-containing protein [Candidatus Angelobacter sp.]|nr:carboxypeptidase regulatory-like domain-containing protein [Candidatus Angelobacter sp.]
MKVVATILFFGITAFAATDTIRVSAGGQLRVSGTNATAAYTIDSDCADVEVDSGVVIVSGKRPCTTHLVTVTGDISTEREVLVSPGQAQLNRLKAARMLQRGVTETGYFSTLYSSDPGEVETSFSIARTEGDHTASMSVSFADGYAFSRDRRKTALPFASVHFAGPHGSITLLDSFVDESPLTLSGTDLRGLHLQRGSWFLHGGIASLTNFRQRMFDPDPDRTLDTGYRFAITRHSGIITSTQWIHASSLYTSGRSGVVGSIMYDYYNPERLRFQAEIGINRKLAGAGLLDYTGERNWLQLQIRSTPLNFPGLSAAPARGFQANGHWSHQLTARLGLDISGSRDTYSLLSGTTQANTYASSRLQWRINRFTLTGGFNHAELSRQNTAAIISDSFPAGLAFDARHFGNSIQYQYRRNRANDLGSYFLRDSIRISSGPVLLTAYAARQTQAPTIDFIVTNVPGLRQALLDAGITATTPEEILDFLRTHASLIGSGIITNLSLNIAPVRMEYGGTFKWTVRRNLLSLDLGYRAVDDERIVGHVKSTIASSNAALHLSRTTTIDLTGSMLETRSPGGTLRSPLIAVGLRQQIGNVPDFLNHFQEHGWIKGVVFMDEGSHSANGMAGVTVILDGIHETRTNTSGFYYFHAVPKGKHLVEAHYHNSVAYVFTTAPQIETEENTVVNFGIQARKALLFGTVHNDAGIPIGQAAVRLEDIAQQVRTSGNGSYRFNLKDGGTYTVTIDPQSLPPAYDLLSVKPQTAKVGVNDPARIDFVVRALRSIYGTVHCTGAPLDNNDVTLKIDGADLATKIDQNGNYKISDLAGGWHEITISYGPLHLKRRLELPGEPTNLGGIDFEVCAAEASAARRVTPP